RRVSSLCQGPGPDAPRAVGRDLLPAEGRAQDDGDTGRVGGAMQDREDGALARPQVERLLVLGHLGSVAGASHLQTGRTLRRARVMHNPRAAITAREDPRKEEADARS